MSFLENGCVEIPKSIIDVERFACSDSCFCGNCGQPVFVDENCGDGVGLCKSCRIVSRIKRIPQFFISRR